MDSTGLTVLTRWTFDAQRDGFEFAVIPGGCDARRAGTSLDTSIARARPSSSAIQSA